MFKVVWKLCKLQKMHICGELSAGALVLKLLTAPLLVVTSVIGRFLECCFNHGWVFSGTACMNFDFLQVSGPTDRRFLAQNLGDSEPPALSASVVLLLL